MTVESWLQSLKNHETVTQLKVAKDAYNVAYGATTIRVASKRITIRIGKKTPKKHGWFTVLWEKDYRGNNVAYDASDFADALLIAVSDFDKQGVFLFSKKTLIDKGILKTESQKGKMGFRIYAPWEENLNQSAKRTQAWQSPFYYPCTNIVSGRDLEFLRQRLADDQSDTFR